MMVIFPTESSIKVKEDRREPVAADFSLKKTLHLHTSQHMMTVWASFIAQLLRQVSSAKNATPALQTRREPTAGLLFPS